MPARIEDLKLYENVDPKTKSNILLGNGLSIGVSDRFAYSSLRRVALDEHFFAPEDNAIFDLLDTSDFENVLRRLREALELNQLYELPPEPLRRKHRIIRSALAKSIRHVHPEYQDVEFDWLQAVAAELTTYKTVFTTSYDLLLYWIIGSEEFRGFTRPLAKVVKRFESSKYEIRRGKRAKSRSVQAADGGKARSVQEDGRGAQGS